MADDAPTAQATRLPMLYKSLVPLTPSQHGNRYMSVERNYDFAATANAIPLTGDEFPQALRHYPIVISGGDAPTPVALVGRTAGTNDQIDENGNWRPDTYVPAYLRRYPFAFLRQSPDSDRNVLCGDIESDIFVTEGEAERALFQDGAATPLLERVLDFCNRFDSSMRRTSAAMKALHTLDLIEPSAVNVTRDGKTAKIEGFNVISEAKLTKLPDETLAGLARNGTLNMFFGHQISMSNFSSFGRL